MISYCCIHIGVFTLLLYSIGMYTPSALALWYIHISISRSRSLSALLQTKPYNESFPMKSRFLIISSRRVAILVNDQVRPGQEYQLVIHAGKSSRWATLKSQPRRAGDGRVRARWHNCSISIMPLLERARSFAHRRLLQVAQVGASLEPSSRI